MSGTSSDIDAARPLPGIRSPQPYATCQDGILKGGVAFVHNATGCTFFGSVAAVQATAPGSDAYVLTGHTPK